jgi:hypothetical protein
MTGKELHVSVASETNAEKRGSLSAPQYQVFETPDRGLRPPAVNDLPAALGSLISCGLPEFPVEPVLSDRVGRGCTEYGGLDGEAG